MPDFESGHVGPTPTSRTRGKMNKHKINWNALKCVKCGFEWGNSSAAMANRNDACEAISTEAFQYYIPMVSNYKIELPEPICKHIRVVRSFNGSVECLDCGSVILHNKVILLKKCAHKRRIWENFIAKCLDCGKQSSIQFEDVF